MKKTLLLSAAALMVASTAALSTNSVSAYSYDRPLLRQNGTQVLREAKNAAELQIRNLLNQYHVDGEEYSGYFNSYYSQARQARNVGQVDAVINSLEENLQNRQNND
ncbi:TPA: hypothetical protein ACQN7J_001476 [Streptococcus pyogenes]|uniref:hypothetical protein n=1 Tax=Streptococcus pyogenes TaxID=1314 RepID=UPI0000D7534E|nr:hypothetical protein [Streptococcus pyogenes]ERL18300.1 hypothetical protein HMPREF1227_1860 [Streptococcus pyogenes GA41046]HER4561344.1 hypothetical protein [Streptococcus pyogenes NGAS671]HER4769552.1 hypothetical protein [Streptococcus pyogenes NGAS226]ABF34829.1 hypothetical protein MGAS10270_Spy1764 [Streptococcus pyogenes MGAS10270]PMD80029.1 hypothetical protein CEH03_06705 [Streptococcus pyogenes]